MEIQNSNIQKITPCLWFNDNALEAVNYYTKIFKNSKVGNTLYYGKNAPLAEGMVLSVSFMLEGQEFIAFNVGAEFTLKEAISFIVNCDSQKELDHLVMKLSEGGLIQKCGWLKDKFGISWQIIPSILDEMLQNDEKADRVMRAVLRMGKINIDALKEVYNEESKMGVL